MLMVLRRTTDASKEPMCEKSMCVIVRDTEWPQEKSLSDHNITVSHLSASTGSFYLWQLCRAGHRSLMKS